MLVGAHDVRVSSPNFCAWCRCLIDPLYRFRTKGAGELYAYFPTLGDNDTELKKVEPETILNDTYGTSVGRGSFTWKTGACKHHPYVQSIVALDTNRCYL